MLQQPHPSLLTYFTNIKTPSKTHRPHPVRLSGFDFPQRSPVGDSQPACHGPASAVSDAVSAGLGRIISVSEKTLACLSAHRHVCALSFSPRPRNLRQFKAPRSSLFPDLARNFLIAEYLPERICVVRQDRRAPADGEMSLVSRVLVASNSQHASGLVPPRFPSHHAPLPIVATSAFVAYRILRWTPFRAAIPRACCLSGAGAKPTARGGPACHILSGTSSCVSFNRPVRMAVGISRALCFQTRPGFSVDVFVGWEDWADSGGNGHEVTAELHHAMASQGWKQHTCASSVQT